MNETLEKDLKDISKEDIVDLERGLDALKGIGKEIAELTDKYTNFRLQLIAIAGATFSIYVALQSHTDTHPGFIKYGFIALAVSLLFGFLSIALSLLSKGSTIWYKLFDFDKSVRSKGSGMEKLLEHFGFSTEHRLYDEGFKKMEEKEHFKLGMQLTRKFVTSTSGQWAFLFGIGQIVMFLIATVLLVIGLLSI